MKGACGDMGCVIISQIGMVDVPPAPTVLTMGWGRYEGWPKES